MTRRFLGRRPGLTLGWALAGTLVASMAALAQGPGGPPPFGGPDGPPPFGRPGGPPPTTVMSVPLTLLDAKLKLTTDQDTKISQIRKDFETQRAAQTDPASTHALCDAAIQKVTALLTADQQKALPGTLAETEVLRADAIPLEVYGDLKLTAAQETQLTAIGQAAIQARRQAEGQGGPPDPATMRQARQQTDAKVAAVLTDAQRQVLDKFRQSHPRPGPGAGPDGPPPPDGSGPPPDGMGPPPPDGDGPPPPNNG